MASYRRPLSHDGQQASIPEAMDAHSEIAPAGSDPHASWLLRSQQQPDQVSDAPGPALRSTNPFYRGSIPQTPRQAVASRPPMSPSASSGFSEVAQQQRVPIERAPTLGSYFSIEEVPRTTYTDQDLADIAQLLRETGRKPWSQVPRIYTVLRLIGQVMAIDSFLEQGVNDMWFPFNVSQLPQTMSAFHRGRFIDHQNMVMTKALDLEKSGPKRHTHFKKGEQFPLTIGDTLGQGGYGAVYKAYSPLSGRTYALKTFRRTRKNAREVQSFMVELQVLQRINHHHCVELVASYTDSRNFGLLMSPVADYNLSAFYEVAMESEENQKALCTFFGCLVNALRFLHESKIRHRDIKPENILVKGPEVYLTDFGISLDWENLSRSTTTADSAKSWTYCAPEVADYQKRNSSSDVYSLGCVFLEMWTVLKGATAQDLRKLMLAHSGRSRYYENLDVVVDWAARLSGDQIESEEEVMAWIKGMLVIEPSARITAQELSSSIANLGKKGRNKATENTFCGDCCAQENDEESLSESVSDDDVWGGEFGDDITTPATSPPATDPALRSHGSSSTPQTLRRETLLEPVETASLESLAVTEAGSERDMIDLEEDDTSLLKASKAATSASSEPIHPRTTSLGGNVDRSTQEEVNDKQAASSRQPEGLEAAITDISTERETIDKNETSAPTMKNETSTDLKVRIRQEAVQSATNNNRTWPFTDLQGRLPALISEDWETPSVFLNAIRSDLAFMEYLKLRDAQQFERFEAAAPQDLFPAIHLLLLNGLDVNNSKFKSVDGPRKGSMPLYRTLSLKWTKSPEPKDIGKLLLGFGAKYDCLVTGNYTCLARACSNQDVELVDMMLNLDSSNINLKNGGGGTPVQFAAQDGRHVIVEMLIKHGADFRVTHNCWSPGLLAAQRGHLEVMKVLIENGMGVDEGASLSSTLLDGDKRAIHYAAERGKTDMVKYLLSKGADPTRTSGLVSKLLPSSTPYRLAKKNGHEETARVLQQAVKEWKRKR